MNPFCSPLCRLHLSPLIINEHLKNNSWMIYEDSQWLRVIRNFWQSSSGISNIDRHWLAILEEVLQQTTVREIIYHPLFWKCIIERFQGLFVFNIWSLCDMTVHKETASLTAEFKTQNLRKFRSSCGSDTACLCSFGHVGDTLSSKTSTR